MSVFEKLSKVQSEVKATKDAYNSFGKYNYRSCESILEAVKPILKNYHCSIVLKDEVEHIGERFYIKAIAEFIDCESEDKQSVSVSAFAREEETKKGMDGAQVTGSSSSYARKYALAGLLLLDDNKDPDATNKHGKDKKNDNQTDELPFPDAEERVSAKDIQMLEGLFALEPDGGAILSKALLKGRNIKSLTKDEYGEIMNKYNKYKTNMELVQKRLGDGTQAFANKANIEYDAAKQMIQDSLEIDFNKVQPKDLQTVLNQIKEMIESLSVSGDTP